jgi:ATP phosphoribosyltransferase regulatory subunit
MNSPLLPSGLMDILPPVAQAEFDIIRRFLRCFMRFGYQPVIPPLAEYAETILAGQGEATKHHVLQLSDPLSGRMLGLRADMTGQVARIAGSSLGAAPRPLRLCYAGYTLRAEAEPLQIRRQHTQVGIERFGDIKTPAISEVLAITAHALAELGVDDLTIDLHYSSVMQPLLNTVPESTQTSVREAAYLKDTAQLRTLGANVIADIIDASGDAATVLTRLKAIKHPAVAMATAELAALVEALAVQKVNARVSIDMLDLSGYGYYCGIGYALYWNETNLEVGRGGCYEAGRGEKAVGFTLYLNDLLEKLPPAPIPVTKTIPYGTSAVEAERIQLQGFVTVFGEK